MMKHEFEELAGYEVTCETYNRIIEPMYMALPDSVSKSEFVAMLNKKALARPTAAQYMKEVKKEAAHLFDILGHSTDHESERRAEAAAKAYAKRKWGIDWAKDIETFVYFEREYQYPLIGRGCTFPKTLVIGRGSTVFERVPLFTKRFLQEHFVEGIC